MKNIFYFLVLSLLSTSNVLADTVKLNNGNAVKGKIVEQTSDYIKIDAGVGFPVTYYTDEIADILKDGETSKPGVPAADISAPSKIGQPVPGVPADPTAQIAPSPAAVSVPPPVSTSAAAPTVPMVPTEKVKSIAPVISNWPAAQAPSPATVKPAGMAPPLNQAVKPVTPEPDQTEKSIKPVEPAVKLQPQVKTEPVIPLQDPFQKGVRLEDKSNPPLNNLSQGKNKIEMAKNEKPPKAVTKDIPLSGKSSKSNPEENSKDANKVGNEGIALIQDGKMDEGLALVKKATELDPNDPSWHMNYGSMLFSMGSSLFKDGSQKESLPLVQEAEKELMTAAKIYSSQKNHNVLESQCYFLLGDMYNFIFQDKDKALEYYEKTVSIYPQHQEARDALKNFSGTAPKIN